MSFPIKKTIEKVPGGMMIVPLFLGIITNTFFPQLLQIGGFTTALFSKSAFSTILATFMFLIGSQISFSLAPKAIKKGILLIVGKFTLGAGIGIFIGKVFGSVGIIGLTPLAIIAALTNCNGGLYASLASQYGDETDVGAYSILSIKDGPFLTLIALGASGFADIPLQALLATILPIIIGMVLGNLDPEMRVFLGQSKLLLIPFFSFPLGAGMNLFDVIKAGPAGIVLGFIAAFTGIGAVIMLGLFKENPLIGFATGTTAGNAVGTPAAVAALDPTMMSIAAAATAQVAASCIVTAILCPIIVSFVFKRYGAKYAEKYGSQKIKEECLKWM